MKNFLILLIISVFIFSCSSSKMNNFLKYNDPNYNKAIFKKDIRLYFISLSQNQVDFYMQKVGAPTISIPKNIEWEKYLINPDSKDSETEDYLDEFGLSDDNYGYKSAKDFFASTYSEIFQKGMSGESQKLSKFKPKSYNITSLDNSYFQNLPLKTIYSPKDSINLQVFEPKDLNSFCKSFKEKYNDANFLIIVGKIFVTQDMFENNVLFKSPTDFSFPKGTIFIPKVVIDLDNNQIAGYHVGNLTINPGGFNTVRGAIEAAMISDTEEVNFFF